MKLLHVITSLQTGGAERLMVDLLPRFKEKGYDVDLCILNGKRTPFYEELFSKGIKIFDFGEDNSVYSFKNIARLRKLMKGYDIVHTHNTAPQYFAVLAKSAHTKLVTTEHGGSNRRRKYKLFKIIDRWMYNHYDEVICISDQAEENLRRFINHSKAHIHTIYNGVDIARCANAQPSQELKRDIPQDARIILMVAGFRWEKDQDTLIKALSYLPEKYHLFFAGDGVRRQECEELAKCLDVDGRTRFLGIRTDIPNILKAADYIVLSSHFEGLSLSSVEGMSVGKPFLASDVDGLREVVKGHGVLFPHQDSKALADEILKLDSNPSLYKEVTDKCFARANDYDISKMVENYLNIYTQLAN